MASDVSALAQAKDVKGLVNIVKRGWGEEQEDAAKALGALRDCRAIPALARTFRCNCYDSVRMAAAQALGAIAHPRAIRPLRKLLLTSYRSKDLRMGAAEALGAIGGPKAIRALRKATKLYAGYCDSDVGEAAARALAGMEESPSGAQAIRSRAAVVGIKGLQRGGGTVEWDGSTDSQQAAAEMFPPVRTADPKQATAIAFDKALKLAKRVAINEVYRPFNEVAYPWGAKRLYRGPVSAIRSLVLDNLTRISHEPEFRSFNVLLRNTATVQINALFPEFFIGVQVWQSHQDCLANGNSDFGASSALLRSSGIKVETAE